MMNANDYMHNARKGIDTIFALTREFDGFPSDIFVETDSQNNIKRFEMRDYTLADTVDIVQRSAYCNDYDIIEFSTSVRIGDQSVKIDIRHEGWNGDSKRYAQGFCRDNYHTERHDQAELLDYYRKLGVNEDLLDVLKQKVEDLYKKPLQDIEEDATP